MNARDVARWLREDPRTDGVSRAARAVHRVLLEQSRRTQVGWVTRALGDRQLQQWTGYQRTAVKAARKELVDAGLVVVVDAGSGGDRSRYLITEVVRP